MERLERVLDEKATELARRLTDEAGFTDGEARRFLAEAGPALIESYQWQASARVPLALESEHAVRDLLAGIWGRTLAQRLGLSQAKTWAGLRTFVPAVVDASAERRRGRTVGTVTRFEPPSAHETAILELRFGAGVERPKRRPGSSGANGRAHPSLGS